MEQAEGFAKKKLSSILSSLFAVTVPEVFRAMRVCAVMAVFGWAQIADVPTRSPTQKPTQKPAGGDCTADDQCYAGLSCCNWDNASGAVGKGKCGEMCTTSVGPKGKGEGFCSGIDTTAKDACKDYN